MGAMCPDNFGLGRQVVHQAGDVELALLLDVEMVVSQELDGELEDVQPAVQHQHIPTVKLGARGRNNYYTDTHWK